MENKKIAIVYDWFDKEGGAERIIKILLKVFPQADIFTSFWDKKEIAWLKERKVYQSFLSSLPFSPSKRRKLFVFFYPFIFESFKFDGYDYVISLTAYFSKSIITKPQTKHICYFFTPIRFLWRFEKEYLGWKRYFLAPYFSYLRQWDYIASKRPDKYIFISNFVKDLAEEYYKVSGQVIYPPFDFEYWKDIENELKNKGFEKFSSIKKPYFLYVSRLEPYKRVDIFLEIAKKMKKFDFVVVGSGSLEGKVKKIKLPNLFYFKNLSDLEVGFLYKEAKALIMPQQEEFGYTALESLFFGTPVIYYKNSGTQEIVEDFGIAVEKQYSEDFLKAIEKSMKLSYNLSQKEKVKKRIFQKFGIARFKKEFLSVI